MAQAVVKEFRCSACPFRFTLQSQIPVREGGVQMLPGRTYCKGGKKYRAFRSRDPKTFPPAWCPRQKLPCEFRIYAYKDTNTWYLQHLLRRGESVIIPSGYQCAVRKFGTVDLSPAAFFALRESGKTFSELLGTEVNSEEIVEIDDGLKPCCFFARYGDLQYLPYWDTALARKNVYQSDESTALGKKKL